MVPPPRTLSSHVPFSAGTLVGALFECDLPGGQHSTTFMYVSPPVKKTRVRISNGHRRGYPSFGNSMFRSIHPLWCMGGGCRVCFRLVSQHNLRGQSPKRLASCGRNRSGVVTLHYVGGVAHVIRHEGNAVLQVLEIGRKPVAEAILNPLADERPPGLSFLCWATPSTGRMEHLLDSCHDAISSIPRQRAQVGNDEPRFFPAERKVRSWRS